MLWDGNGDEQKYKHPRERHQVSHVLENNKEDKAENHKDDHDGKDHSKMKVWRILKVRRRRNWPTPHIQFDECLHPDSKSLFPFLCTFVRFDADPYVSPFTVNWLLKTLPGFWTPVTESLKWRETTTAHPSKSNKPAYDFKNDDNPCQYGKPD